VLLLASAGLWCVAAVASENDRVEVVFFYGRGCPHCGAMRELLRTLQAKHPQLRVREYEVYFDRNNARLFERMADAYKTEPEAVPTVFVGSEVIVGFSQDMHARIDQTIRQCIEAPCASPLERISATVPIRGLTLSAVLLGAAVDAINPCEFAVLIILLTAVLGAGGRRRALYAGLAFSSSVFLSYYLMGIGLYSAIEASGFTRALYIAVAFLAILIGLFNLKDYLWYGKWFLMEVPLSWRPKLKQIILKVTSVPGAFLVGFVVSLFLLPCTSGPYIVILAMLAEMESRASALLWLLLYNAVFITPMIAITAAVYFGLTTAEAAEEWRGRHLQALHLVAGTIVLLLGLGMLTSLWLGYV
jgi:cytochrome c biogenesis protein CcdA/glutaredoxin